jgi:hypothetical protein
MSTFISDVTSLLGPVPASVSRVGRSQVVSATPTASIAETVRNVRMTGSFDKAAGRVVTQIINQGDGSVVTQFPDPRALRVLAGIRQMVGLGIDEIA